MKLPFDHSQFLEVFGHYNVAAWPAAVLLWLATLGLFVAWMRSGRVGSRSLWVLLAAQWACSGVVYFLGFFRAINPAAVLFSILFLLQAVLFSRMASQAARLVPATTGWPRSLGAGLIVYALAYPFINLAFGMKYPELPTFGVPCPTVILTAGALLLAFRRPPVHLVVVPIIWSIIGGSAAVLLSVPADFALPVAGFAVLLASLLPALDRSASGAVAP